MSNIKEWVRDTTFHPVPKSSVMVNVGEATTADYNILAEECAACCRVLAKSHILDQIDSVNWKRVDSFNIKETLVCVCVRACMHACVRACMRVCVCVRVYIL